MQVGRKWKAKKKQSHGLTRNYTEKNKRNLVPELVEGPLRCWLLPTIFFQSRTRKRRLLSEPLRQAQGPFSQRTNTMWKPTLYGISCLTSLKRKRRNNVWIVNMYLKNLRLRFRLVKICNKKLCSLAQERTVAHASDSERCVFLPWLCFSLFPCNSVLIRGYAYASFRVIPWQCLCSV